MEGQEENSSDDSFDFCNEGTSLIVRSEMRSDACPGDSSNANDLFEKV